MRNTNNSHISRWHGTINLEYVLSFRHKENQASNIWHTFYKPKTSSILSMFSILPMFSSHFASKHKYLKIEMYRFYFETHSFSPVTGFRNG